MKKGKFLSMLVVAVTSAALLVTGCSGNKQAAQTAQSTDDTGKPYEIQWYFIGNPGQSDMAAVETEVNKYLKDKINATVKMNSFAWGTYEDKVNMMLASGEPLDLVYTSSGVLNYSLNAAKGAFLPLNDLLDKNAPETKKILGDQFLEGASIDGKLYALPVNKDKAHNFGFVYRKDIAEKYQFDMDAVTNFEDLEPYLKVIQENEPDMTPLGFAGGRLPATLLDFDFLTYPIGFESDSDSDQVSNLIETNAYYQACKLAERYFNAGYVRKDCAVSTNYGSIQKDGGFFISLEQCKPGKADEISSNSNGYVFAQKDLTPPRTMSTDATGSMMAIPVNCKNPDRVIKFLDLMYTDKYLNNLIVNGIEGKHYTKTGDNRIEALPDSGYTQAAYQWMFGNVFLNYLLPTEADDKFEKLEKYNNEAEGAKTLGFAFDSEPVRTEVAAIENVKSEFAMPLETGSVNVDSYIQQYRDKLKSAGISKVIAEVQKQYDAWKSSQNNQ